MYILETELLNDKPIAFAIINIYGIGKFQSFILCKKLGFSINLKIFELSNDHIAKIINLVEKSDLILNNDLKKLNNSFLKKSLTIKIYKSLRKIRGLPVRGQRTHTNAKTARQFHKK